MIAAAEKRRILATAEISTAIAGLVLVNGLSPRQVGGDVSMVQIANIAYGPTILPTLPSKWRVVKLLVGGGMVLDSGAHFTDDATSLANPKGILLYEHD